MNVRMYRAENTAKEEWNLKTSEFKWENGLDRTTDYDDCMISTRFIIDVMVMTLKEES
ncbi:MAG: hypothetical protein QW728_06650 [Thermoplasmata archaeon]